MMRGLASMGKVVMLAKGYFPDDGGIERYSREMAQAYSAMGYSTYVLTQCSGPNGVWRDGEVMVENVGQRGGQVGVFLRMLLRWRTLRQHISADVVHATTWRVAAPAFILPLSAPLVITIHGREVLVVPTFLRPVMRACLSRADIVVAVSPTIARLARAIVPGGRGRWTTAWNGLSFPDVTRRLFHDGKQVCIYTFCRLVERKNVDNALRAIAELVRRGHGNFRYVIAGDGPMRSVLTRLVKDFGLEGHVTLLGRIAEEQIHDLYRHADIFLHPQIATANGRDIEGFGLTIADAMSLGVAVVAGVEGGPADFIEDGRTGLLVDGHSPSKIADALERLMIDTELRNQIAERGRKWALENFSWRKSAETILIGLGRVQ